MTADSWIGIAAVVSPIVCSAIVVAWRSGQVVAEVRGVRGEIRGLTDWLTKVEGTGSEQGKALTELRVSVARVEASLERSHQDSDRVLRAVKGPE